MPRNRKFSGKRRSRAWLFMRIRVTTRGVTIFLFYFAHKVLPGQFCDIRYDGLVGGDIFS